MEKVLGALLDFWPLTALLALAVLWYGWKRLRGSLRLFVMMAAGSVAGFLVAVFLHNAVYALSARWWGPPGLEELCSSSWRSSCVRFSWPLVWLGPLLWRSEAAAFSTERAGKSYTIIPAEAEKVLTA